MGVNVGTMTTGTEPLLATDYLYLYRSANGSGSRATKFAADALVTKTAAQELTNKVITAATVKTSLTPATDDGAALGSVALKFSDLFLANGAVINFNNGDLTLTHSSNQIAASGAVKATGFKVGSNAVVGARITGYAAMTGSANKAATYDTATVTLPQLAGRLMQLQADLTTHGLIGP